MRYAGAKGKDIYIVSDKPFQTEKFQIHDVPDELDEVPSSDLIVRYRVRDGKIVPKRAAKPARDLRVAFVVNWKMYCGIATYNDYLLGELAPKLGDYRLFIEESEVQTEPLNTIGGKEVSPDNIISCWKRGHNPERLIAALKEYDPDIIYIGHEFGLWPNARYWLSMMNQLSDYRIVVTMHSVFHHKDKTIVEAAIPEIIVHLNGAQKVLKEEKQVSAKVHVLSHGCTPNTSNEKLWNFYKSEQTFCQMGFLFSYKGWANALQATAILKKTYPNVFFTGLMSESPFCMAEHEMLYRELMELVRKLDIVDNVALIRGFQSDAVLDSYLRTNKASIFPYVQTPEHEVFGASGAARFTMTRGIPVVTSRGNHFSDLPTIKAETPEEMAFELSKLFSDWKAAEAQVNLQNRYLEENSWKATAERHLKIFENP